MKLLSVKQTTLEDVKVPHTVYKYRAADNSEHMTILTERVVYFAPPESFDDKLDCKIPIRYDLLTDDQIFENYLKTLKEMNPEWDSLYLRDQAIKWSNLGLLRDKNRLEQMDSDYYKALNERFGVLCLTAKPANKKMWENYSKSFNGFCVGFDTKIMFKFLSGGGRVIYHKELPIILTLDPIELRVAILTFSKLKKWQFEKEYRTHMFWPYAIHKDERKVVIPGSAFTELILGHKTKIVTQKEIIKEAKKVNPAIQIKITSLLNNKITLLPYA